ncbi:hypothetical protein EYF80_058226 [Liparis tanakae]|uniref:Uncharacterized protein n=1 Tax=Liparis tanakae TaxID=230148 RepID=A0A4Z2ERZ8_9TELE|nr:hypothetical protein EYF80_058226 [Liparis tanakae]
MKGRPPPPSLSGGGWRGSVAALGPSPSPGAEGEGPSPGGAAAWGGLGGRGGGGAWLRESTLGVEAGRRRGRGPAADAGRGTWYPLVEPERAEESPLGRGWRSRESFLGSEVTEPDHAAVLKPEEEEEEEEAGGGRPLGRREGEEEEEEEEEVAEGGGGGLSMESGSREREEPKGGLETGGYRNKSSKTKRDQISGP